MVRTFFHLSAAVVGIGALLACNGTPRTGSDAVDTRRSDQGAGDAAGSDGRAAPSATAAGAVHAGEAGASADATSPAAVVRETTPVGRPYDLRVDGDEVSFCDRRGARVLSAAPGADRPSTRPCAAQDTSVPQFHCSDGGGRYEVTIRRPHGLETAEHLVEASSEGNYACIDLTNSMVACASDDSGLIASTTDDGVFLWDVVSDDLERLDGLWAWDVAIGPAWVAWLDEKTVRARRRTGAGPGAPRVPTSVTYRHHAGPGGGVDYPTFLRPSCNADDGAAGWHWGRRASLDVWVGAIQPGEGPESGCHLDEDAGAEAHREVTKDGCFTTALVGGEIHWLRERYICGKKSALEFRYDAALKSAFDPIVTYVNRSWQPQGAGARCRRPDGG